jgi:hypothetical protein
MIKIKETLDMLRSAVELIIALAVLKFVIQFANWSGSAR